MPTAEKTGTEQATGSGIPSGFILNKHTVEVIMRIGEAKLVHRFNRPKLTNWNDYLRDLKPGFVLSEEKGWAAKNDEALASSNLWDATIVEVEGYKGADAPDWKKKIPVNHKMTGVKFLQDVWVEDSLSGGDAKDDDGNAVFDLEADSRTIILAATSDGFKFDRLVHVLRIPSADQEIRFERTRIHYIRQTGDSNRVISPPRLRKMAELYDELIESVEGYAIEKKSEQQVEDGPVAMEAVAISSPAEAQRHMDPLHKQAAVLAAFSQQPTGERVGADAGRAEADEIEV